MEYLKEFLTFDLSLHFRKEEDPFKCLITLDITSEEPISSNDFRTFFKRSLEKFTLGEITASLQHFQFRVLEGKKNWRHSLQRTLLTIPFVSD